MSDEVKQEEEATDIGDNQEDQPARKHPGGRPTEYNEEYYPKLARALAKAGFTDEQIAKELGVQRSTLYNWKMKHPEFLDALKDGKDISDDLVEASLYQRATGYYHKAVKIFMPSGSQEPVYADYIEHLPPDPTSMIFWLKNRRPKQWRDKVDIDATVNATTAAVDTNSLDADTKAKIAQAYAEKIVKGNDGTNNS